MFNSEDNIPEAVLVTDDIEVGIAIPIPINERIHPELLVNDRKCALYKFCCFFPLGCLSIILMVYYLVEYKN